MMFGDFDDNFRQIYSMYVFFSYFAEIFTPNHMNAPTTSLTVTPEAYHGDTSRISKSGLDLIAKSPAHYFAAHLDPNAPARKETDAMAFGSLLHCLILEPSEFHKRYAVEPDNAPKKPTAAQWKAQKPSDETQAAIAWWTKWYAENDGKHMVDADDVAKAEAISAALYRHPVFEHLMFDGVAEQVQTWEDPYTLAPCKLKLDWMSDLGFIVDVKSTEDASAKGFAKSVLNYRYHVQAAFYMDGYYFATGEQPKGFIFAAVEKQYPYLVQLHTLDEELIKLGRVTYQRDLETYMECKETGKWPGYPEQINWLSAPKWALNS